MLVSSLRLYLCVKRFWAWIRPWLSLGSWYVGSWELLSSTSLYQLLYFTNVCRFGAILFVGSVRYIFSWMIHHTWHAFLLALEVYELCCDRGKMINRKCKTKAHRFTSFIGLLASCLRSMGKKIDFDTEKWKHNNNFQNIYSRNWDDPSCWHYSKHINM